MNQYYREHKGYKSYGPKLKKLRRLPTQGVIAGVIAGFAHHWGLSRFWLRIIVLVLLFSMPALVIPGYLLFAFFMPEATAKD